MNCPSRNDEVEAHPDWNQSPNALSSDLTTRQDLNGIANLRISRHHLPPQNAALDEAVVSNEPANFLPSSSEAMVSGGAPHRLVASPLSVAFSGNHKTSSGVYRRMRTSWIQVTETCFSLARFVGPGFLVAVAYIDPGNYATDVAAGAATKFKLLFIVLMASVFAVVLQSLSIRLGTVTGKNLSEHCREHLPKWLNISIYCLAEAAIILTDVAEVCRTLILTPEELNIIIPPRLLSTMSRLSHSEASLVSFLLCGHYS